MSVFQGYFEAGFGSEETCFFFFVCLANSWRTTLAGSRGLLLLQPTHTHTHAHTPIQVGHGFFGTVPSNAVGVAKPGGHEKKIYLMIRQPKTAEYRVGGSRARAGSVSVFLFAGFTPPTERTGRPSAPIGAGWQLVCVMEIRIIFFLCVVFGGPKRTAVHAYYAIIGCKSQTSKRGFQLFC